MRIDELKKIATENDYELRSDLCQHSLKRKGWDDYINISAKIKNHIWVSIVTTCDEKDFNMIKAAVEFAETPLEDRVEEKKFYLKHRYLQSSFTNSNNILCYSVSDDKLALGNGINFPKYKTYLTLEEIENIKEKFDTDLADFELVEVEE